MHDQIVDMQTDRHTDGEQTHREDKEKYRQIDKQTGKDRQTNRQAKKTDKYQHKYTTSGSVFSEIKLISYLNIFTQTYVFQHLQSRCLLTCHDWCTQ